MAESTITAKGQTTVPADIRALVDAKPGTPPVPLKFYFQHFTSEHQARFIDLYNTKKLNFGDGPYNYLYTMPFFMRKVDKADIN